ncbi:MAG: putative Ig domain-containing protein, partial [Gemmataceae bacterium]|nr:putative Ig domain-containing protein [Gemmataceae bacterium]
AGEMLVWWSVNGIGDADGVFLQRLNSDGVKVGGETRINVTTTGTQSAPQIAVDLAGNFVVAWQGAGNGNDIWYRRFSAAGTALDLADIRANSSTASEQTLPSLAVDAEGDFTLAWADGTTPNLDVRARFFKANGTPFGADFRVNTYTTNDQTAPHVSLDADGDAIITWQSFGQSSGWDVFAQRVSRAGSLSGTEFQLNTYTTGDQTSPRVAYDADGDLAAVWVSNNQVAGSGTDVFQRLYDRVGTSLQSIETRLNRTVTGNQNQPAIMADADGDFAVTWAGYGKTDSDGVFVQRNTFFLPEVTGLPNVTVTGGTTSTVISLFDYYLDDPNFSEASTFYFVQNTGTSPGLFSSYNLDPNTGRLTIVYTPNKHGESPIKVRVRDTTELPLDATFVARVLPTIGTIAPQVVNEGSTITVTPTGSTSAMAGDANLWSLDAAPSGMSINSATGKVTWTPGDGPLSTTFTIRLSSTLIPAITSTRTVSITVNNVAPTATFLTGPGTTAVDESAGFTLNGATDVSTADITAGLKYSFDFDGNGTFEITNGTSASVNYVYPSNGSFTAKARVEDKDGGFTDYTVPVTVLKANNAPTLDTIANQSATESVAYSLQTVAGDVDAGQSLAYFLDTAPSGMTISGTGLIQWTPTEAQGPGSYPVTVRVTDNGLPNKSATRIFTINVAEVNSAPQLATISNFTINEGQLLSFGALGTDPDDTPANALTYSLDAGFPTGASVHATSGLFQWTPPDNGVSVITLRVTDNGVPALSATRTFTVTVNNIAPTATSLTGPASAKVDESIAFTLNGVTDAPGDTPTLKYSFDWTNDGTFDVVDAPSPTQNTKYGTAGPYTVRARVSDKDGGAAEYTTNITITSSAPAGPKVQGVTVNDGSAQRSRVTSLTVAFNSAVDFAGNPADAFVLTRQGGGNVTIAGVEVSGSTAKLTFSGPTTQFASLIDGRYTLTILAGNVSAGGTPLDGNDDGIAGGDYSLVGDTANKLFRLYGDADGNGTVNTADFLAFRLAFLSPNPAFDFDGSGSVDTSDFLAFRLRFLQSV